MAAAAAMVSKAVAFFVALVGAVSALFAMVSLRRMQKKQTRVEILNARQEAQAKNDQAAEKLEAEITKTVAPVLKLTNSKEDREDLAALLDE